MESSVIEPGRFVSIVKLPANAGGNHKILMRLPVKYPLKRVGFVNELGLLLQLVVTDVPFITIRTDPQQ